MAGCCACIISNTNNLVVLHCGHTFSLSTLAAHVLLPITPPPPQPPTTTTTTMATTTTTTTSTFTNNMNFLCFFGLFVTMSYPLVSRWYPYPSILRPPRHLIVVFVSPSGTFSSYFFPLKKKHFFFSPPLIRPSLFSLCRLCCPYPPTGHRAVRL